VSPKLLFQEYKMEIENYDTFNVSQTILSIDDDLKLNDEIAINEIMTNLNKSKARVVAQTTF